MTSPEDRIHRQHLLRAAMLALRGHGGAEPNPMVGCVIVSPGGETVGWGYHRQVGGPHAEVVALRRAGARAKGATLYCTLEPCNHHGRTGPCSQAVIDAGVSRVIIARHDPWPNAAGGLERIAAAGIETRLIETCEFATRVCDPFAHRMATGLPWVTVKWAQTQDGCIALAPGSKQRWISNESSRAMVHRERGRVDAILTGIGTVLADDPLLTPRGPGVRLRRSFRRPASGGSPLRVVADPQLRTPLGSQLVRTAREHPLLIACRESLEAGAKANELRAHGAAVCGFEAHDGELALAGLLRELAARHDVATVLVEAGRGLMTRLFRQRLVNEAWVFTAPFVAGERCAMTLARDFVEANAIESCPILRWSLQERHGDSIARYLVTPPTRPVIV